jgi:biotin carboxyl carrier protein
MRRFEYVLRGESGPEEVRVEGEGDSWRFTREGRSEEISVARLPDGRLSILFPGGRQVCGRAGLGRPGEVVVVASGEARIVHLADPLLDRLSHAEGSGPASGEESVLALMPGRVLEVRVSEGDRVESGQVLVVLEAMKMQNEIRAASAGVVARCAVSAGQAVEGQELLLVIRSG